MFLGVSVILCVSEFPSLSVVYSESRQKSSNDAIKIILHGLMDFLPSVTSSQVTSLRERTVKDYFTGKQTGF